MECFVNQRVESRGGEDREEILFCWSHTPDNTCDGIRRRTTGRVNLVRVKLYRIYRSLPVTIAFNSERRAKTRDFSADQWTGRVITRRGGFCVSSCKSPSRDISMALVTTGPSRRSRLHNAAASYVYDARNDRYRKKPDGIPTVVASGCNHFKLAAEMFACVMRSLPRHASHCRAHYASISRAKRKSIAVSRADAAQSHRDEGRPIFSLDYRYIVQYVRATGRWIWRKQGSSLRKKAALSPHCSLAHD